MSSKALDYAHAVLEQNPDLPIHELVTRTIGAADLDMVRVSTVAAERAVMRAMAIREGNDVL